MAASETLQYMQTRKSTDPTRFPTGIAMLIATSAARATPNRRESDRKTAMKTPEWSWKRRESDGRGR